MKVPEDEGKGLANHLLHYSCSILAAPEKATNLDERFRVSTFWRLRRSLCGESVTHWRHPQTQQSFRGCAAVVAVRRFQPRHSLSADPLSLRPTGAVPSQTNLQFAICNFHFAIQSTIHGASSHLAAAACTDRPSPESARKVSSRVSHPAACFSSAAVPSPTSLPRAINPIRSQSLSASAISCVVRTIVVPRRWRSRSMKSCTSLRLLGSRPVVGSSSSTSGGSTSRARAMLTFCCMPRLISSSGSENRRDSMPRSSSISSALCSDSPYSSPYRSAL